MIRVGIIGFGYSAKTFHIPLIEAIDSLVFTAISSSQPAAVREKHPNVAIYESPERLVVSGELDLVVITAPNAVHFSLAKLCLENDIHVVLEKPMTTTSLEAQTLVALAKERSLVLSVFHNRRWDGDFLTVKRLIEAKRLGEVRYFESHFDRFRPNVQQRWREQPGPASGIWFDLGPHLVDQAMGLFGLPLAVTARCLPMRDGAKTTDYFHVQLHYENLEVVLHASSFSAAPNCRFRVEGTEGSYLKYGLDVQEGQLKHGVSPNDAVYGVESEKEFGCLYLESSSELIASEQGCYQSYYEELAQAINLKGANPVDPAEAATVIQILELAESSSVLGERLFVNTNHASDYRTE